MDVGSDSLEQLFLHHYRALCLYALHYVDGLDEAEDVVMDCFVRYAEKCSKGNVVACPKSYLYRMVYHLCADVHRKSIDEVSTTFLETTPDDSDMAMERSEREARLWSEIDKLSQHVVRFF